ncbi:molybdate ABC transporter substrate-binding protein [Staphylococcus aureus]|nr:molybdate ABC transporter substrate-binding protein [Staphylococcus aureus]MCS4941028.1 molybdate ABC transporter substrate-binding protein [Staphylococcus aureus]MCS4955731.1 molybdate ABC transporter substrate-binding protein [Staphylococcus aureus]MCS5050641.1 molybdate ABC transporter substrate-binding protein [Staphylococcus aureus]
MKMKRFIAIVMALFLVLAGCSNSNDNNESKKDDADNGKKQEIQVAAAASLTDVTKKLASEFKKEHKNADIKFNYGGSGALRKQIESGAPVDVFMSANTKDVDALKDKNKAHDTYKYAKNSLVLIGDKDSNYTSVKDLKDNDKLALGEVKTVPAGKYAKQGFVYKTDLYKQNKKIDTVKVIKEVELKKPITYEAGATSDSKLAKEWMEFLKSDKAKEILKEYHFAA